MVTDEQMMSIDTNLTVMDIFSNPVLTTEKGINEFAAGISAMAGNLGEDPFPLSHSIAGGVYTREVSIPRGVFVVGKIHKTENLVNLLKGSLVVCDKTGMKILKAPLKFKSEKGIRRIAYTFEDVVWVDIYSVTADNVSDIEHELFEVE